METRIEKHRQLRDTIRLENESHDRAVGIANDCKVVGDKELQELSQKRELIKHFSFRG